MYRECLIMLPCAVIPWCESRCWVPAPTKLSANHLIKAINSLIAMLLTFGTHRTSPKLLDCQTSKDQCTQNSHRLAVTFRNQLWLAWFALVELTFIGCIQLWLTLIGGVQNHARVLLPWPCPKCLWLVLSYYRLIYYIHYFDKKKILYNLK